MWKGTFQIACNPNRWGVKGELITKTSWMTLHTFSYFVYPRVQYVLKTFKGLDRGLCTTLFEKESYILDLVNHENIIKCMEIRHTVKSMGLVFPKPQWTLEMYIEKKRSCGTSEHQMIYWGYGILKGLDYLHTQVEVIHRNIHPGNIFLMSKDHVCLAGFEYAQRSVDNRRVIWVDTIGYRAPEMILQRVKPTYAVDIFSTGATFFFMVHGFSPFSSIKTVCEMSKVNVHMLLDDKLSRNCRHLLIDMMEYPSVRRPSTTMCLSNELFRNTAYEKEKFDHQWYKEFDTERESRIIGHSSGSGMKIAQAQKGNIDVTNESTGTQKKLIDHGQDIADSRHKTGLQDDRLYPHQIKDIRPVEHDYKQECSHHRVVTANVHHGLSDSKRGVTDSYQKTRNDQLEEKEVPPSESKYYRDRVEVKDTLEKFEYVTETKKEEQDVKKEEGNAKYQQKMSDDFRQESVYENISSLYPRTVTKEDVKIKDVHLKTEVGNDTKLKEPSSKEDENVQQRKDYYRIAYCDKDVTRLHEDE